MTAQPVHRGTSNSDVRGSSRSRRRRRDWLVQTYRADVDVIRVERFYVLGDGEIVSEVFYVEPTWVGEVAAYVSERPQGPGHVWTDAELVPACRCYRCGCLLTAETVSADRIKPGCEGGTYGTPTRDTREGRTNIRPACLPCQSQTGAALGNERKRRLKSVPARS